MNSNFSHAYFRKPKIVSTTQFENTSKLAIITVSYNPDLAILKKQMTALPAVALWVIVDNASAQADIAAIESMATTRKNTLLITNNSNLGLAAALNKGAEYISKNHTEREFILLLDQDSLPHPKSIEILLHAFLELENNGKKVGCVGPLLVDTTTGLQHGFHNIHFGKWTRQYTSANATEPVACLNLNGSGTLTRISLYKTLHGLDESFFIDHVDTDWAFRVIAADRLLFGIPQAVFDHSMGEKSFKFWLLGWKVWPYRSPWRHYFLFRNAIRLMKKPYVPFVWKYWAAIKLLSTFMIHLAIDNQRKQQSLFMLKGVRDGILDIHSNPS